MSQPIVMPSFGMYTSEGTLTSWLVADGAPIKAGQAIAVIETDKSAYEIPASTAGILQHVERIGTVLHEQQVLGYIREAAMTDEPVVSAEDGRLSIALTQAPVADGVNGSVGWIKATPIARRIAKDNGLDLTALRGSGPGGRIVEADVRAVVTQRAIPSQPPPVVPPSHLSPMLTARVEKEQTPALDEPRVRSRTPLSNMRRIIGVRLRQSLDAAVSLTLTREVEADVLVAARKTLGNKLDAPVSFDALFVKLVAAALRDHPELNAMIVGDEVIQFEDVNVCVAVAVANGLLTPIVRRADARPLAAVAATIRDWAERVKHTGLRPDELVGGTTTISNLGNFGIDAFTPILNPPQASILGIGRVRQRPVARAGELIVAYTCVLSLTFDHRVADGVPAAQMLDAVARRMNDDRYLNDLV